ncbi:MAG: HAD-IC family P-type ATPase, partial [Sulfurimonas sp.]
MKPESVIWHAVDVDKVYSVLQSSTQGLSKKEVEKRLLKYGPNRMKPPKKWSFFEHFFSQFHNVLIYVLLAAAVVTAFLEHWIDTGVILGVVLINAFIGVLQEGKAEKALDAIRKMLSSQAMVHRDGKFEVINAEELVPGDIVNLQSGDKVPADLRLIDVKDLQIDEAILTGESLPVKKALEPVKSDAAVADRRSMAYSGTLVTYGTAKGIVVATADETEIGHISTMLRDVEKLETPLLKQIGVFSKWLSTGIIGVAIFTLIIGVLIHNYTMVEMFMSGVSMAVAAIPEGLPAIMTIALAIGVQKMAGRQAIIRLLSAVETLGSVTVICSDKTGTLTRNEMTVRSVITASGVFEVSGSGYDPHGSFSREGVETEVSEDSMLLELARGVMLCNDAAIEFDGENWHLSGDPTEGALVVLGMKSGFDATLEKERWPRTDVIPFESQHGFMATLHHNH